MPSTEETKKQSMAAYGQWKDIWREHASHNSKHTMKSLTAFQHIGIGRSVLCIANGYSFEKHIDTIRENQEHCDIICVDKCLKSCIENGITPNYVIVCDAQVSYEDYMESIKDKLQDTILFINVCANPKWADNGNWKDMYFFVNKDVLGSEREFAKLSGCPNIIAAGTNVSNQQIVLLTQCAETAQNYFGYDKILMIGYDYCWKNNYYAFDKDGLGKIHYMKNIYMSDLAGELQYTSTNLLFSARWMDKYIKAYRIPAIQCDRNTFIGGIRIGDLKEQMQYKYHPHDSKTVRDLLEYKRDLNKKIKEADDKVFRIGFEHQQNLIRTI